MPGLPCAKQIGWGTAGDIFCERPGMTIVGARAWCHEHVDEANATTLAQHLNLDMARFEVSRLRCELGALRTLMNYAVMPEWVRYQVNNAIYRLESAVEQASAALNQEAVSG